jgi:hypothetical protein
VTLGRERITVERAPARRNRAAMVNPAVNPARGGDEKGKKA